MPSPNCPVFCQPQHGAAPEEQQDKGNVLTQREWDRVMEDQEAAGVDAQSLLRFGRERTRANTNIYYTLTSAPWAFKTQMVDKNHLGKTAVQLTEWLRSHRSPHSDHTQPTLGTLLQEHLLKCRQTINYYNKWVTEQRGPSVALSQMVELQRRGPGHCQSNSLGTWNIIVRLLKTKYINIHRIK